MTSASKLMIRIPTSLYVLPLPTLLTSSDNRTAADDTGPQILGSLPCNQSWRTLPSPTLPTSAENRIGADHIGQQIIASHLECCHCPPVSQALQSVPAHPVLVPLLQALTVELELSTSVSKSLRHTPNAAIAHPSHKR